MVFGCRVTLSPIHGSTVPYRTGVLRPLPRGLSCEESLPMETEEERVPAAPKGLFLNRSLFPPLSTFSSEN